MKLIMNNQKMEKIYQTFEIYSVVPVVARCYVNHIICSTLWSKQLIIIYWILFGKLIVPHNTHNASTYICGRRNFLMIEYEIFSLITRETEIHLKQLTATTIDTFIHLHRRYERIQTHKCNRWIQMIY